MATYATSTDVAAVRTALQAYVDDIENDDAAYELLLQTQGQLALDRYADGLLALINVNASAASSYSSGIGSSFTKRRLDDIQAAVDAAWADLAKYCALGGVTLPSINDAAALWDFSGGTR
jgi:hypothetical protein